MNFRLFFGVFTGVRLFAPQIAVSKDLKRPLACDFSKGPGKIITTGLINLEGKGNSRRFNNLASMSLSLCSLSTNSILAAVIIVLFVIPGHKANAQTTPDPSNQQHREQERLELLQERNRPVPTSGGAAESEVQDILKFSAEAVCFPIDKIVFETIKTESPEPQPFNFDWALAAANKTAKGEADLALGRCLGIQGIQIIVRRVQNAIIKAGFITTRVFLGPQNLTTKTLKLTLVPGRLKDVRFKDPKVRLQLAHAIPRRPDGLFYLRDVEHGLENLKRVPTAEANFSIEPSVGPSAKPGDSDLVIDLKQNNPLRFYLSLDDAGSETTGVYQGGFTFSWDNPMSLNDLFYINYNGDLGGGLPGARGTEGISLHYSVPFGYWLAEVNASQSEYHQTVAGLSQDYVYRGESENIDVELSRLIHRDAVSKTLLFFSGWYRASRNYIDDTEVEVQRRRTAGWEAGINYMRYIRRATLDLELSYKRGTGAFGAIDAPEDAFGEGASRPEIVKINASLNTPVKFLDQNLNYNGLFRAQWTDTPLVAQDRFSIGSRYTVRGFTGETTLLGERGWLFRNDFSRQIGQTNHAVYLGLDFAQVSGPSTEVLLGDFLAGAALGIKGKINGINYNAFAASNLFRPDNFDTGDVVYGFSAGLSF